MSSRRGLVACGVLFLVSVVSAVYLALGALGIDPRQRTYDVTVEMGQTAGLMDDSPTTMYGMVIGRIRGIEVHRDGVRARVEIDSKYRVPVESQVIVSNLSAAGEQFLDFRPQSSAAPYLRAGDLVPRSRIRETATVGQLMSKIDRLGEMLDPGAMNRFAELLVGGVPDEATVRGLADIVGLMGATARDKIGPLRSLFRVAQELDRRLSAMDAASAIAPVGDSMRDLTLAMPKVMTSLNGYALMSKRTDAWNGKVGPFMDRLLRQINIFVPALGPLAAALVPLTDQLRGIRVNANAFTDLWGRAFPAGGPMRVQLRVN
ncbi:putative Mce family protein [Gordonia crocea]|uniref:Putative Mce family protein n=1 Tax=Gordonia crocea TaxID=589162 RepID=A0A7M3SVG9_9ACTN|nr:putative Mce family protein [Gordonia crocea]